MKKQIMGLLSAIVFLCTGTAVASAWNFYGSARVGTFWEDSDLADEVNFSEYLHCSSRIGAKVKVSDELTGRFEYGALNDTVNLRLLYGAWHLGNGSFIVGKDYTPLYLPLSHQVWNQDKGLHGYGEPFPGRHPQVKLKFGGFQIAAISPNTDYYDTNTNTLAGDNVQVVIPRIEVSYGMNAGNAAFDIAAGYTAFEYNDDQDIDSYVILTRGSLTAGAFNIGLVAFFGQNAGNMVHCNTTGGNNGKGYARVDAAGRVDHVENYGGEMVAGYTVNDMFAVECGFGYMQGEYDHDADKDAVFAYYIQVPVTLAPGVTITPEAGVIDYDEDGQAQLSYVGAKWQINF